MWIFCCGAQRSGSTLQFNIVSEIIERLDIGKRIEYSAPSGFASIRKKYKDYDKFKVFKTHSLNEQIKCEFDKGNAVGIYCYRDIRDVIVSLKHKEEILDLSDERIDRLVENYLHHYKAWMSLRQNLLISSYESFTFNIDKEVKKISAFLGVDIPDSEAQRISEDLSIENQLSELTKYEKESFVEVGSRKFHSKSLLHPNHINDGGLDQWKDQLTEQQILVIERRSAAWIFQHGYKLKWPGTGNFISYSQHAEDYICWQLFNKTKGLIVEVGAFDGIHLSNSISLGMLGWDSICVEANPRIFNYLNWQRPDSINVNVAVISDDNKTLVPFYVEQVGVLSGCCPDEADLKKRYGWRGITYKKPERINVKARTLNSILAEHLDAHKKIDILSIDVEGFELNVLQGFDLLNHTPGVLIIEANNKKETLSIIEHMSKFDEYTFLATNRQNLFFVLKNKFSTEQINSLRFDNYTAAIQHHPIDDNFALQSVEPIFSISKATSGPKKLNFLRRLISVLKNASVSK